MTENFTVAAQSKLEVGAGRAKKNSVEVVIAPKAPSAEGGALVSAISLQIHYGTDEKSLVEESSLPNGIHCKVASEAKDAFGDPVSLEVQDKPGKDGKGATYTWTIRLEETSFVIDSDFQIILDGFQTAPEPGNAKVTLSITKIGDSGEDVSEPHVLEVEKSKPPFGIRRFQANPVHLLGDEKTTISWEVDNAKRVELENTTDDRALKDPDKQKGTWENVAPRGVEATFRLTASSALDDSSETVEVSVRRYRDRWNAIDFSGEGDLGEPLTLFRPETNQKLYAIFRNSRGASLYSSHDGINGWTLVSSTIPEGMETSPGVEWNNKLWLAGGTAADRKVCSNRVFSLDLTGGDGNWQEEGEAAWSARMGHTLLVFEKDLWLLGGYGDDRRSHNDIWKLSLGQKEWQPVAEQGKPDSDRWRPRCMFAATAFANKLWLCCGVERPGGRPVTDPFKGAERLVLWSSDDGLKWTPEDRLPPEFKKGEERVYPWACSLEGAAAGNRQLLHLCFTATVGRESGSFFYRATQFTEWTNMAKQKNAGPQWETNEGSSFSLAGVAFAGRLLLRSLRDPYGERQSATARKLHVFK